MSCDYCGKDPRVLSYNYSSGKFNLLDERGNIRQSELISDSTVHGFTNILASSKHFIAAEGWKFDPIQPRRLVETVDNFLPVFIIKIEYDVDPSTDLEFLENLVPCKALYYSAVSSLPRGLASLNTHFCGRVCSREVYIESPGSFGVNHIPSREYTDCSVFPDPGWVTYTNINFTGSDSNGVTPLTLPILKDYPGVEPGTHRVTIQGLGVSTFNYLALCPQGINLYNNVTAFVSSRGAVSGGNPSLICVPLCQSASAVYPSSFNSNLFGLAYSKIPPLIAGNSAFAEWMFGDYNPNTATPINYSFPIGLAQSCGFNDPSGGRIYFVNDYLVSNQEPVFFQSEIIPGASSSYSAPVFFKDRMEELAYNQSVLEDPPQENDFSNCGIYTFVRGNGVPSLTSGIFSIERLPYRESRAVYDSNFYDDLSVVDYLVILPVTKDPANWVAFSILKMRGYEADSLGSISESTMSLICSDFGEFVFSSCKYGYYEPEQINTNDQLFTAYVDYSYSLDSEGIVNLAFNLERANPDGFSPVRLSGNYGYEPYVLPGEGKPDDVTTCQDSLKHTHTVFKSGQAFRFEENNGKTGTLLAEALLSNTPVDFTLIEIGNCSPVDILSSKPFSSTVSNISSAIDEYFSTLGVSVTLKSSEVIRIKPLPI